MSKSFRFHIIFAVEIKNTNHYGKGKEEPPRTDTEKLQELPFLALQLLR
jgi:hypothetical protein